MEITKDMIIADVIALDPNLAGVLMASGMHCVGCPAHTSESLEEACFVHGLDVNEIINNLKTYLANK
ncbi:MAG: DUF1858 domain-containing protein [Firmicutes bacterium]|nr:DUF1858 domain-containing protein [Bacillota bacterium]